MATKTLRLAIDPSRAVAGANTYTGAVGSANAASLRMVKTLGALGAAFAIGAQIKAAGRDLIAFDAAMTESIAIMGDVSDAMRVEMAAAAQTVGEELNFAAEQGAEAFFFLASAGLDAQQSIAALPAVAEFARAGMFDFATATDLATDAQSALGLVSDDAAENLANMTRVTDVLVKANTLANASVEQFATALTSEAGAAMKTFSIDVEEGAAVLAAFADQGIKSEVAGSGFSRVLRLMSQAAVRNADEMRALGIEFFDAQGNMRNMADVVENLTDVLSPMSDAQRAAALESIGFTARVQGVIQPLLGTADAIREYEAELRTAGGTTAEVANNQMQSLENRIGQVQQEFTNWRRELVSGMTPALIAAIDNIDLAVAAVQGLVGVVSIAAGVALSNAVLGWTAAFVSLAASVRSASAAFALLNLAIGPAGWIVLGASAVAGALVMSRNALRENREEAERAAAEYDALREAMGGVARENIETALVNVGLAISEQRAEVERLTEDLENAAGGQFGIEGAQIQIKLDRANDELDRLIGLQDDAQKRMIELAKTTGDVADALDEDGDGAEFMAPTIANLELAAELVPQLQDEIDGLTLDAAFATTAEQLDDINAQIREAERRLRILDRAGAVDAWEMGLFRAPASLKESNTAASQLDDTFIDIAATLALTNQTVRLTPELIAAARAEAEALRDVGAESAGSFKSEWVSAISVVGASLGGMASQIANIATAFATGGPIAGGAALLGTIIGELGGGPSQQTIERERILEQNTQAIRDLTRELSGEGITAQQAAGASAQVQGVLDEISAFIARFPNFADDGTVTVSGALLDTLKSDIVQSIADEQGIELFDSQGNVVVEALNQLREAMGLFADEIQRQEDALMDSIRVRTLEAQGLDEQADQLRLQIERENELAEARAAGMSEAALAALRELHALEDMARATEEITRARREEAAAMEAQRQFGLGLAAREAALAGDDRGALEAQLQQQAEAELARAQEMLSAGRITEEMFRRLEAVLTGEVNQALADFEESARRASQEISNNLQLRLLSASGMSEEAEALRDLIELEEARRNGYSAQQLALLEQVQAAEAAQRAQQRSAQATREVADAADRTARALNAPQGLRLSLLRFRASADSVAPRRGGTRVPEYERFTGPTFTPPQTRDWERFDGPMMNGTTVESGAVTINVHATRDMDEDTLVRKIETSWNRKFRAGGDPLIFTGR